MTRSRRLRQLEEALGEAEQLRRKAANTSLLKYLTSDRKMMSASHADLRKERDFKEAPMRAGWPTLPPLPVETHDAFPLGKRPLLPNRGFHIQTVRSICGGLGIPTLDINIVLRVPYGDVRRGVRVNELQDYHTKLPLGEYLTMLVTLDFRKYGRWIPTALCETRRALKQCSDTDGLLIEFINVDGHRRNGFPMLGINFTQKAISHAWRSQEFYKGLVAHMKGRKWGTLEVMNEFPDMKTCCEAEETPWMPANEKGRPIILICATDADDPVWWRDVLPALRKWLHSEEVVEEYKVKFGVRLLMQSGSVFC